MDRLMQKILETENPLTVEFGWDFHSECLPFSPGNADFLLEFSMRLAEALRDTVPAMVFHPEYYALYGREGMNALYEVMEYAHDAGVYIILDIKKSMEPAGASLSSGTYLTQSLYPVDAVTVHPYLGIDGLQTYIFSANQSGRSVFVELPSENHSLKEQIKMNYAQALGAEGYSKIGCVTHLQSVDKIKELRAELPYAYFFVPEEKNKNTNLDEAALYFNYDGFGALIGVSRRIVTAYKRKKWTDDQYPEAAREEVLKLRKDLLKAMRYRIK